MGKHKKILFVSFIAVIVAIPFLAEANGGITVSVDSSQIEKQINLSSQQAIIGWDGEEETMLLSTGFTVKELADLAWIIPVPSKTKPEVDKADIDIFRQVPYLFSEIKIGGRGGGSVLFIPLIVGLAWWVFITYFIISHTRKRGKKGLILGIIVAVLVFFGGLFFSFILLVSFPGARSSLQSEVVPLEVIETKQVGIYDIVILKVTDADYMVNWLQEQGYKVSEESAPILQEYCSEPDFYFIVNKVNQEALAKEDSLEDIAMPLEIRFKPEKPFYPLKLSSINGGSTIIDVYLFAETPLRDESGLLSLKKSRSFEEALTQLWRSKDKKIKTIIEDFQYHGRYKYVIFSYPIATWLHYEGDLNDLRKDAYFEFDSVTCKTLSVMESQSFLDSLVPAVCYEKLAVYTREVAFCEEKITDMEQRDRCYTKVAIGAQDYSLCERTTKPAECYYTIALKLKDVVLCGNIKDSPNKEVGWEKREALCYQNFALYNIDYRDNDISLCEKITSREEKETCRDLYYRFLSNHTEDISVCEKITTQEQKTLCKEEHFAYLAIRDNDISLCEKITTQWLKNDCTDDYYWRLAKETNDISVCEKIINYSRKGYCRDELQR